MRRSSRHPSCRFPQPTLSAKASAFKAGLDRKVKEAPAFYSLYTGLIVAGGGIILLPKAPLFKILVLSQVANGVWLPVVLIFVLLLINRRDLMGDHTNSWGF